MTIPNDLKMADYIASTGSALQELRLLVEGAVDLYSEETEQLFWLARRNDQYPAAQSFAAIGTALRLLQAHIRSMQKAYTEEVRRWKNEESVP